MSSMERPELFNLRDHLDSLSGFWWGPEFPFVLVLFFALLWVFVCILHVSRVPNVASVSGLSILDANLQFIFRLSTTSPFSEY
jgi:hypothetical protein